MLVLALELPNSTSTMSDSNVNNAAAPRQVKCEPLDNDQIPADLNALRHSRTFKRKHEELDPEEHDAFPGAFPVKAISRTSKKVDDWCKEHEGKCGRTAF